MNARVIAVLASTTAMLAGIGLLFWHQDWKYSIPLARPAGLAQPAIGTPVDLSLLGLTPARGKPLFLHYFNPACPCSRFNIEHLRSLVSRHASAVRFLAVLQGDEEKSRIAEEFRKLQLPIDSVIDEGGALARIAGVYSTPQAVLLDAHGRLYYRGNYNLSRYCAAPETEFARLALDALRAGRPPLPIPAAASAAYGCPLPKRAKSRPTA